MENRTKQIAEINKARSETLSAARKAPHRVQRLKKGKGSYDRREQKTIARTEVDK